MDLPIVSSYEEMISFINEHPEDAEIIIAPTHESNCFYRVWEGRVTEEIVEEFACYQIDQEILITSIAFLREVQENSVRQRKVEDSDNSSEDRLFFMERQKIY